jgi:glycerate 2-kinase
VRQQPRERGPVLPRVLVCPDSFKGTYSAYDVAAALAEGVRTAGGIPVSLPLADGGEGTAQVLREVLGGSWVPAQVADPLGRPVAAGFVLLPDQHTAVVDVAAASGLTLVPVDARDAEAASSYGTGQLIAKALESGARRVLVACGGSATTDGGEGALDALSGAGGLGGAELLVLCDVRTPFERAAEVFAPQKGADEAAVRRLAERLHALADGWPRDPRGVRHSGAAGGLSGGLWATLGASLVSGIDTVLDAVGFERFVATADLIITGEGRLDTQSAEGKVVAGVLDRAGTAPVHVACGEIGLEPEQLHSLGIAAAHCTPTPEAMRDAAAAITGAAARELAENYTGLPLDL